MLYTWNEFIGSQLYFRKSGLMRYTKIPNAWREVCKSTKCGVLPKSRSQHSDVEPRVHQIFKKEVEQYLEQTSVVCFSFGFVSSNCVVHGCRISSVCSLFCSWEQSLAHSKCLRNYSESIKHQCFQLTFCFEFWCFVVLFFFLIDQHGCGTQWWELIQSQGLSRDYTAELSQPIWPGHTICQSYINLEFSCSFSTAKQSLL